MEETTNPVPVLLSELILTGNPGGFVRGKDVLTNDPTWKDPPERVWTVKPKPKVEAHEQQGSWTAQKRERSSSTSSTSSTSPDKKSSTSPTKSPAKKSQKTSSTTSKPGTSHTVHVQPSTSHTHEDPAFDPSNIHEAFRRYCAVVDQCFSGRKYWEMKLTVLAFTKEAKEARTLCEVGFVPVGRFKTFENTLAHPDDKTFIVKIGMHEKKWRALWAQGTDQRSWTDVYEATTNQGTNQYSFKFGLFLDTPHQKISFYAADADGNKKFPGIVFTAKWKFAEGYPIFSLGESVSGNVATVRLEMDNAARTSSGMIAKEASERDDTRRKEDAAKLGATKQEPTDAPYYNDNENNSLFTSF